MQATNPSRRVNCSPKRIAIPIGGLIAMAPKSDPPRTLGILAGERRTGALSAPRAGFGWYRSRPARIPLSALVAHAMCLPISTIRSRTPALLSCPCPKAVLAPRALACAGEGAPFSANPRTFARLASDWLPRVASALKPGSCDPRARVLARPGQQSCAAWWSVVRRRGTTDASVVMGSRSQAGSGQAGRRRWTIARGLQR